MKPDLAHVKRRLGDELTAAVGYSETHLQQERIDALDFYLGKQFNKVPDGQSRVVSTEVADVVEYILPSLMEIYMRSGDFVRFVPRSADDVAKATAATLLVNSIFTGQNNGFLVLHDFVKDALICKNGVVKVYYDETVRTTDNTYEFEPIEAVANALADDDEIIQAEEGEDGVYNSVTIRTTKRTPKVCVDNIPPEDFFFSAKAKSLETAGFTAHRSYQTVSDLVAMGYPRATVEKNAGLGEGADEQETQARHEDISTDDPKETRPSDYVRVVEAYMQLETDDGDKLHRIVALGDDHDIVEVEEAERVPFATASPIRVPHRMVGRSIAETMMEIQKIKSSLWRGALDNMNLTNHQRMTVVENAVNLDDLLVSKPRGIVRQTAPGMVAPLPVPQIMDQSYKMLGYTDEVRDQRAGFSKASLGLDPDALQSTTASAVNATIQAGQIKVQMIARLIAETGLRDIARLILETAIDHFDQPHLARVGEGFEMIDPAELDIELDVEIDVGLGSGRDAEKMQALERIAVEQKEIIATLGLDNPLVTPEQYLATIRRLAQMSGIRDSEDMFASDKEIDAFRQEQKNKPPEPSPEMAEIQGKLEIKRIELDMEYAFKEKQLAQDKEVRLAEIAAEKELRVLQNEAGSPFSTNLPRA